MNIEKLVVRIVCDAVDTLDKAILAMNSETLAARISPRQAAWNIAGCLLAYILLQINFNSSFGGFRLVQPQFNEWTEILSFLLPTLALPWLLALPHSRKKICLTIILLPIAVISLLVFFVALLFPFSSDDLKSVQSIPARNSTVKVYLRSL